MPTNYTKHYQLNQWEPGDAVHREDFNADNARIDAALKAEADARTTALEALTKTVAGHTASIAKLGNCQIEVQSYTGYGGGGRSFSFSHKPMAIFVQGTDNLNMIALHGGKGQVQSGGSVTVPQMTWSNRSVSWSENTCNRAGTDYILLALLDAAN